MRRYAVRIRANYTNSPMLLLDEEGNVVHLNDAVSKYGIDAVLKDVFGETESYEEILRMYKRFLEKGSSDGFAWMYEITEEYGVILDAHITLCKLDPAMIEQQERVLPWKYPVAQMYLADTWWFSDEEIL